MLHARLLAPRDHRKRGQDGGSATVRTTKEVYKSASEAQDAAAVLGLFVVAGDRRMDRLMPSEFVPLWKEAAQDEASRAKREVEMSQRKAQQDALEASRKAKREALLPLFLSESLRKVHTVTTRNVNSKSYFLKHILSSACFSSWSQAPGGCVRGDGMVDCRRWKRRCV